MTRLFVLGATGYIGGDALHAVVQAHPEYEITAMVRNSDKGASVAKQYPSVKLVYGDLDSFDLIAEQSAQADIVFNWAHADHEGAAKAIVKGLSANGGFYIHTSGTGILCVDDAQIGSFGEVNPKIYNDWDNVDEVTSLPDAAPHRNVDKIVLAADKLTDGKVKTAIVCPPTIYGVGRGPDNQRSVQVPALAKATLEQGHGLLVEKGQAHWTEVHVHDLSDLYVLLVQEAVKGGGAASWGPQGYYFCQSAEFVWGDVAKAVAQSAFDKGYIESAKCVRYSPPEIDAISKSSSRLWGQNSRSRAIRAGKLLGWKPKSESLVEGIAEAVEIEAKKLGIKKGHAIVAAGDA